MKFRLQCSLHRNAASGTATQPMACPGCGSELAAAHCHLVCSRCGYFEDCSDGMLPQAAGPPERRRLPTKTLHGHDR